MSQELGSSQYPALIEKSKACHYPNSEPLCCRTRFRRHIRHHVPTIESKVEDSQVVLVIKDYDLHAVRREPDFANGRLVLNACERLPALNTLNSHCVIIGCRSNVKSVGGKANVINLTVMAFQRGQLITC